MREQRARRGESLSLIDIPSLLSCFLSPSVSLIGAGGDEAEGLMKQDKSNGMGLIAESLFSRQEARYSRFRVNL